MKNDYSTIIVDDEPLGRKMIKEYLQDFPEIKIVGECKNGKQAVKAINEDKPDLVFLDIRMPGMDGFEVLEHIDPMPRIIFTTAYDDYALKAFEVNAADYLLKPYDRKRFSEAIQKVIDRSTTSSDEVERILRVLHQSREPEDYPKRVFVRLGRKIISVQLQDISWIEAYGDYTQLHTNSGTHLCNLSMNALEQRLDSNQFLRVHRSYIIATNSIDHLEGDGEGGYTAFLKDKSEVKVSRNYSAKLRKNIW
jgi:two-component system LytT family response regulator